MAIPNAAVFPVSAAPHGGVGSAASPVYSNYFIPIIWAAKLLEKFYDRTVLAAIANTDYEGEISKYGDTVVIRTMPTLTIRDYEIDQELVLERPSSSIIELKIDKGKYFNCILDDVIRVQSDQNLLDLWASDAAEQLKIKIDTAVLAGLPAQVSADNAGTTAGKLSNDINLGAAAAPRPVFPNTVAATEVDPLDLLVDMGTVLDEQNIPEQGRWAIIPSWYAGMLLKGDLRRADVMGDDTSAVRNGRLGMLARFTLYESNLLPYVGGDNAYHVLAGHSHGLTFASQLSEIETIRSEMTFGTKLRGLQVYGSKVIDGTALVDAYVTKGNGV